MGPSACAASPQANKRDGRFQLKARQTSSGAVTIDATGSSLAASPTQYPTGVTCTSLFYATVTTTSTAAPTTTKTITAKQSTVTVVSPSFAMRVAHAKHSTDLHICHHHDHLQIPIWRRSYDDFNDIHVHFDRHRLLDFHCRDFDDRHSLPACFDRLSRLQRRQPRDMRQQPAGLSAPGHIQLLPDRWCVQSARLLHCLLAGSRLWRCRFLPSFHLLWYHRWWRLQCKCFVRPLCRCRQRIANHAFKQQLRSICHWCVERRITRLEMYAPGTGQLLS